MRNGIKKHHISVEELAERILIEARQMVEKLEALSAQEGLNFSAEKLQDAFISFSQVLMLAYLKAYQNVEKKEALEQELFLAVARLVFEELLSRSPTENEFDYFLTYYRSHLELLKKELCKVSEDDLYLVGHHDKFLSFYLKLFLEKGKISH